jgi:hypothetical protein
MREGTFGREIVAIGLYLFVTGAAGLLDPRFMITTPGVACGIGVFTLLIGYIVSLVQRLGNERHQEESGSN